MYKYIYNNYNIIQILNIVLNIYRELSNKVIPSETATFSKNNAAKPPIPTKVNVTNGSKGEWTPETDNLKEMQVRI